MKIAYLGAGTWGFALMYLLQQNGHDIVAWARNEAFVKRLEKERTHPKLPEAFLGNKVRFTSDLQEALSDAQVIIESVSTEGIRPVFTEVKKYLKTPIPIILTSKGIEQNTLHLLPEVLLAVLGESYRPFLGCLSGPSHAEEVVHNLPTSVVAASYAPNLSNTIVSLFTTLNFRVYPTQDMHGICCGGALKNPLTIACSISDGLGFGINTKAALMTRGLHEMRKLAATKNAKPETLNGLSGLGDLCASCFSEHSRNNRFGTLLAKNYTPEEAKQKIGMVVEGLYTCVSALELAKKHHIPVPVIEATYGVIYEKMDPKDAVKSLLTRPVKLEHL